MSDVLSLTSLLSRPPPPPYPTLPPVRAALLWRFLHGLDWQTGQHLQPVPFLASGPSTHQVVSRSEGEAGVRVEREANEG